VIDKASDYNLSSSTILTARFGHESVRLIHSVQKNLYIVIAVIAAIAVLSVLNIAGALNYFSLSEPSSEEHEISATPNISVDKIVDITLFLVLLAVMAPLILLLLKSQNVLDRWSDMFERNTITNTMAITMTNKSKEEAILALAQSIQQISEPLQDYIDSKRTSDLSEFLNVSINNANNNETLVFDVLLDSDHVLSDDNVSISDNLKSVLDKYGAVIVKIVDGNIHTGSVESYVASLMKYISVTRRPVGIAFMIGESLSDDANKYLSKNSFYRKSRITQLILMAKPSSTLGSETQQTQAS
jgi:hypothetical protein